jgi:hypothetical protein
LGTIFPRKGAVEWRTAGKVGGWEKKRMKNVLRFVVELWHARFRGFGSKASMGGVCPDAKNAGTEHWTMNKHLAEADLQKRGCNGEISRPFARIWLVCNALRMALARPLQVIDFSPVTTIFHDFSPIFHPSFQPEELDFSRVTEITWFRRTLARGKKVFFGRNDRQPAGGVEFIYKGFFLTFLSGCSFINVVRFNQRNCS